MDIVIYNIDLNETGKFLDSPNSFICNKSFYMLILYIINLLFLHFFS